MKARFIASSVLATCLFASVRALVSTRKATASPNAPKALASVPMVQERAAGTARDESAALGVHRVSSTGWHDCHAPYCDSLSREELAATLGHLPSLPPIKVALGHLPSLPPIKVAFGYLPSLPPIKSRVLDPVSPKKSVYPNQRNH